MGSPMTIQLRQLGKACAALCMLLGTPLTAVADVQQELLLFPSLQGFTG